MITIKNEAVSFGHPRGLFYLFFAELWERFSFYGMRALLVLYMTKQLLFTDDMSFGIFAAYMSLVYFTPLIGGILADNYLGYRKAIIWGGLFMALGHFILTVETSFCFYLSLSLIIVGNGFFKPNISSLVGTLYKKDDVRRDAGFTIFYMGINIGAAIAPLLCAWVAELYGWHYGFVLAGIGMMVGLYFFWDGIRKNVFGEENLDLKKKPYLNIKVDTLILISSILSLPFFAMIIKYNQYEHYLVWLTTFFILGALAKIYKSANSAEQTRLFAIVYYTVLMTLFWAIFEQAGSSLTLFADRNVSLIGMNAAQTNSINGGFIIFLAIPFSWMWNYLSKINKNPNSAIKAGLGLILLGLGFVVFAAAANSADHLAQTPMSFLVLGYFVLTVGELLISPIGLSKMTQLSPPKYLAFIMGIFFTSSFYGHFFAGKIAKLTSSGNEENIFSKGLSGQITEFITGLDYATLDQSDAAFKQLYSYVSVYANFGTLAMAIGFLGVVFSPVILKAMAGVK